MRYLVITDVHGNHRVLEAALAETEQYSPDVVLFLGDYISDGPCPWRIMELLRMFDKRYLCHFVRGNREEYMLKQRITATPMWSPGSQTGSLWYSWKHLTEADLDWFARMPISAVVQHGDTPAVGICHATPANVGGKSYCSQDPIHQVAGEAYMKAVGLSLLLCGHAHRCAEIVCETGRIVFCPSLGLPLHVKTPEPMLLTTVDWTDGGWQVAYHPLAYDVAAYRREIEKSEFYEKAGVWAACVVDTLSTWQNSSVNCLVKAREWARLDGIADTEPLPEDYFTKAAAELGICVVLKQKG